MTSVETQVHPRLARFLAAAAATGYHLLASADPDVGRDLVVLQLTWQRTDRWQAHVRCELYERVWAQPDRQLETWQRLAQELLGSELAAHIEAALPLLAQAAADGRVRALLVEQRQDAEWIMPCNDHGFPQSRLSMYGAGGEPATFRRTVLDPQTGAWLYRAEP